MSTPAVATPKTIAHCRAMAAAKRAATHCKRGHEFTKANTIWRRDNGRRQCRTCANDRWWYGKRGLKFH
jgi:hypothetical protein